MFARFDVGAFLFAVHSLLSLCECSDYSKTHALRIHNNWRGCFGSCKTNDKWMLPAPRDISSMAALGEWVGTTGYFVLGCVRRVASCEEMRVQQVVPGR